MKAPETYVYIGQGAYLPGLPTADLSAAEIKAAGYTPAQALASGLYTLPAPLPEPQPAPEPLPVPADVLEAPAPFPGSTPPKKEAR